MKVLIDGCAPRALKGFLSKHGQESLTVQEAGWSGKENGELLAVAETQFDVLVTVDTNLRYQQNLTGRRIAIVVLHHPPIVLNTSANIFWLLLWRSRKLSPGKSLTSAALAEDFRVNRRWSYTFRRETGLAANFNRSECGGGRTLRNHVFSNTINRPRFLDFLVGKPYVLPGLGGFVLALGSYSSCVYR